MNENLTLNLNEGKKTTLWFEKSKTALKKTISATHFSSVKKWSENIFFIALVQHVWMKEEKERKKRVSRLEKEIIKGRLRKKGRIKKRSKDLVALRFKQSHAFLVVMRSWV